MKIFLASSIFIIACVSILPSDVRCARHAREEKGEYEMKKKNRKRDTEIASYFKGPDLQKVCGICRHKYDINFENCIHGKREARYKCLLVAKDNEKFFQSKLDSMKTAPHAVKEAVHEIRHITKRSVPLADYFKSPTRVKVCSICNSQYGISKAGCLTGRRQAEKKCRVIVKQNRKLFETLVGEASRSPADAAAAAEDNLLVRRGSPAIEDDYFKGENLAKVCEICAKYYGINETDCMKNDSRTAATGDCRKRIKENPQSFASNWTKPNSSDAGQENDDFGTAAGVQKVCSFCDEKLGFDFKDCVADRNDIRSQCKTWIVGLDSLAKETVSNGTHRQDPVYKIRRV